MKAPKPKPRDLFVGQLSANGWKPDTRSAHYKHERTMPDGSKKLYRVKLQSNSWRLEHQVLIPAQTYSPASKQWIKIKGDYYKNTAPDAVPKLPGSDAVKKLD